MAFLSYTSLKAEEFAGLSTFQFLAFFRRALFYGFVAVYLGKVLLLTTTEVTLMATLGMIANTSAQSFLWGNLLDKYKNAVAFVVIGEIIAGIGQFILYAWHYSALATGNFRYAGYTIIVGLALIEVFWSQSNVGWSALLSELTETHERKTLMSQLSFIGGIGGIFGATTGGYLYASGQGFEDGMLFYLPGIIMILSGVLVYFTIKTANHRSSIATEENVYEKPNLKDLPSKIVYLYVLFLIALTLINFGRNSIALISSLYIVDKGVYAATDQQLALYRNVSSIFTMLMSFLLSTVLSKSKDEKILIVGIIFAITAIVWLIFAPTFYLALIASALIGAAQVIIQAASYAIVAKIIPEAYRGRLFAYYNATFFLSWGIGATIMTGPIADFFISKGYSSAFGYRMSFSAAAFIATIGLLAFLYFLKEVKKVDAGHYDTRFLNRDNNRSN